MRSLRLLSGISSQQGGGANNLLDSLVCCYDLDGNRVDSNATLADLTQNNTVGFTTGKLGQAAVISSSAQQYLYVPYAVTSFPRTFAGWVKCVDPSATNNVVISHSNVGSGGRHIYIAASANQAQLISRNNTITSNAIGGSIVDTDWHHIVGVAATSTDYKVYLDSVHVGSSTTFTGIHSGTDRLGVGVSMEPSRRIGNTNVDQCCLWLRALDQDDIDALWNGGAGLVYPDWKLVA